MTAATSTKERRTQVERTAAARAALVSAAITLLSNQGYAHTTTAVIAQHAGVTTGALHHHFQTKEGLFMAALDQLSVEALALFARLTDAGKTGKTLAALLVDTLWELYGSKRYWAVWEINMGFRPDKAMHDALIAHREKTRQRMNDAVAQNEALSADTKRALSLLLPFLLSSMRGIFLDTFFAGYGTSHLTQQLDVLKQVLAGELERPRQARPAPGKPKHAAA